MSTGGWTWWGGSWTRAEWCCGWGEVRRGTVSTLYNGEVVDDQCTWVPRFMAAGGVCELHALYGQGVAASVQVYMSWWQGVCDRCTARTQDGVWVTGAGIRLPHHAVRSAVCCNSCSCGELPRPSYCGCCGEDAAAQATLLSLRRRPRLLPSSPSPPLPVGCAVTPKVQLYNVIGCARWLLLLLPIEGHWKFDFLDAIKLRCDGK